MPVRRADSNSYTLATNLGATGPSVAIKGGEYAFTAEGTAGGSTISLQAQSANGAWYDVVWWGAAAKFTTLPACLSGISLPACNVRMAATGGAPSGLYSSLNGLG